MRVHPPHPEEVAKIMGKILPCDIATKISRYVGSPVAPILMEHYNNHPNLGHWEIPRRFGNFIMDEVSPAFMCCCCNTRASKVAAYCTMCKVGVCEHHVATGCWCSVLTGLKNTEDILQAITGTSVDAADIPKPQQASLRTSAFSQGRYRLSSPYNKYYTKAHIRSGLRESYNTYRGSQFLPRGSIEEFYSDITNRFLT